MPRELDYITVKGFKSIASIEKLQIRPINILIGSNGAGKSNLIRTFKFLHSLRLGRLRNYVVASGGADKLLHYGSRTTQKINLEVSFLGGAIEYSIELSPTGDDGLYPSNETIISHNRKTPLEMVNHSLSPAQGGREAGISEPSEGDAVHHVAAQMASWRLYHLRDTSSSSPMRKTASVADNRALDPHGVNLPAFLYLLAQKYRSSFDLIEKTLRRVAPYFDRFDLAPLAQNSETIKLEWRHKNSDMYFDAASLSGGTLRFIALATLFLQPVELRPSVILVDEPELGLHPYAIEILASLIKQASTTSQVIVSTQSPLLIDHFQPDDIAVVEREAGATTVSRLDAVRLASWLEEYSLGQLWEKNELGGRPKPE